MEQHAVLIHLCLSDSDFGSDDDRAGIGELSDRLEKAIEDAGVGELDGDEFGEGECVLFLYGPDADALFAVVEPLLRASPHARGGFVLKQYGEPGDPDTREVRVEL